MTTANGTSSKYALDFTVLGMNSGTSMVRFSFFRALLTNHGATLTGVCTGRHRLRSLSLPTRNPDLPDAL